MKRAAAPALATLAALAALASLISPVAPRAQIAPRGTVTSVACGTGLTCSQSPITSSGTMSLTSSSVTVGGTACSLGSTCTPTTTVGGTSCSLGASCTPVTTVGGTSCSLGASCAPATTVNGQTCTLGSTCTISAVTSVTGTAPIASSGGATPAISLNDTAVTPGTYNNATITVDAQGRLTAASSGDVATLQTLSWSSATPAAIAPASGCGAVITLTANITSWSISNGTSVGQTMRLVFVQGAAGPWSLGANSNAANILIAGGGFTLGVTEGQRDDLTLWWDGTNWNEVGRALAASQ